MNPRLLILLSSLFCALLMAAAEAPKKFEVGGIQFTTPSGWEWVESASPMRKAQLRVPGSDAKKSAEVIFFHFGKGGGGGTKANIERWFNQFQEPREKINARSEVVTFGKHKVTFVTAEGTYKSGMPGGPQTPMPGSALLGAIIESDEGDVFIRMTGPKDLTEKSTSAFKKMIEAALKA